MAVRRLDRADDDRGPDFLAPDEPHAAHRRLIGRRRFDEQRLDPGPEPNAAAGRDEGAVHSLRQSATSADGATGLHGMAHRKTERPHAGP